MGTTCYQGRTVCRFANWSRVIVDAQSLQEAIELISMTPCDVVGVYPLEGP